MFLNNFAQFWFLEQVKIIIPKCFKKNLNKLLKKKGFLHFDNVEISSDPGSENSARENSDRENSNEENSNAENFDEES